MQPWLTSDRVVAGMVLCLPRHPEFSTIDQLVTHMGQRYTHDLLLASTIVSEGSTVVDFAHQFPHIFQIVSTSIRLRRDKKLLLRELLPQIGVDAEEWLKHNDPAIVPFRLSPSLLGAIDGSLYSSLTKLFLLDNPPQANGPCTGQPTPEPNEQSLPKKKKKKKQQLAVNPALVAEEENRVAFEPEERSEPIKAGVENIVITLTNDVNEFTAYERTASTANARRTNIVSPVAALFEDAPAPAPRFRALPREDANGDRHRVSPLSQPFTTIKRVVDRGDVEVTFERYDAQQLRRPSASCSFSSSCSASSSVPSPVSSFSPPYHTRPLSPSNLSRPEFRLRSASSLDGLYRERAQEESAALRKRKELSPRQGWRREAEPKWERESVAVPWGKESAPKWGRESATAKWEKENAVTEWASERRENGWGRTIPPREEFWEDEQRSGGRRETTWEEEEARRRTWEEEETRRHKTLREEETRRLNTWGDERPWGEAEPRRDTWTEERTARRDDTWREVRGLERTFVLRPSSPSPPRSSFPLRPPRPSLPPLPPLPPPPPP